ncbi:MAG TPA: S41 family peptidase [Longimicrobium sp.]|jgi:hypothetical protein
MNRAFFTRGAVLFAAAALLLPAAARAQARLPETPAGRRAAALFQTVMSGDTMAVRAFVAEQMAGEFQEMPMERHQQMFARLRGSLGSYQITSVREQPNGLVLIVNGVRGPLRISMEVEPAPPHRIAGLGVGRADENASQQAPAPATLTARQQAEVVDSIGKLFEAFYLLPDSARVIAARLKERAAAGAYTSLTAPADFAQALTTDIRAVNDDKHLRVVVRGPGQGPGPGAGAAAPGGYRYLEKVEMMPGQVGYLKLAGFAGAPEAADEIGRALRELQGSRAMVIDLRGNRGGSARLANVLISHFTDPGLVSLHVWSREEPADTVERRTLAEVPGPRRTDVPLFVLVDSMTVSAGEDVPFVLKNLGRATLIGEVTRGGGRNNMYLPAGHGLSVSISVTKVWDPCTGREWERTGVEPHVRVPAAQALDEALKLARQPERYRPGALPQRECRTAPARTASAG